MVFCLNFWRSKKFFLSILITFPLGMISFAYLFFPMYLSLHIIKRRKGWGIHYTACSNSWQAGKLSLIPPARKQLRSRQTTILYTGTYRDRGKKILFIYNSYGWSHFVILLGSYDLIMVFPNKKNCVWNICLEYVYTKLIYLILIIKREYCDLITGRIKGTV